jgi:hypothetical protein
MIIRGLLIWVALIAAMPTAANATGSVALKSSVFVERVAMTADGKAKVELRAAESVSPGDKLVFILTYRNETQRAVPDVVITNPVPAPVVYEGAAAAAAEVSVDGGRTWGPIGSLRIADANGQSRQAMSFDVTHIRWALGRPVPPGASGRVSFRGVVR